jgi:hypothetical protein
VDGPVFRGDLVRWDDIGTIPFDALGAPGWRAAPIPERPIPERPIPERPIPERPIPERQTHAG